MQERRQGLNDALFWTLMSWFAAAIMGATIAYVFAVLYGAGWLSGAALGGVLLVAAGWILSSSANSSDLPPPNTLRAPVAPAGGAFVARRVGSAQAPAPAVANWSAAPEAAASTTVSGAGHATESAVEHAVRAASTEISNAAETASAAVSGAFQSARASLTGAVSAAEEKVGEAARLMGGEARTVAVAVETDARDLRPTRLDRAREGGPDDLKRIKGVGPKLEELLHSLGYFHFDQIASWSDSELTWVDSHLEGFNGRATRDDWVGQSKTLAAGGETEHSQRVDRGEST